MTQLSRVVAWLSGSNPVRDSSPDNPGVEKKTEQIFSSADAGDYLRIGFQNHHHQKFIIEDNHLTIILLLYIIYYIRI